MNLSLLILQDTLVKQNKSIREALVATDDPAIAEALTNEMFEISHRIQLIPSLLFVQQSTELEDAVAKIKSGAEKLNKAVEKITNLKKFLDTVSDFLALVDEAIDLAKKIGIAV